MYGTIATMKVLPGKLDELERTFDEEERDRLAAKGWLFSHIYRLDSDPDTVMLAVGFKDEASYRANAESPEMYEDYERYRALLAEEPEWHDGEIVQSLEA